MRNKILDSFAINFIENHFDEIDLKKCDWNIKTKDAILKLRRVKIGESLTIHENKYEKLVKINKLLRELLRENETFLKNIESAQGVWRSSKDGGGYCP